MNQTIITLALPVFVALIAIELLAGRLRGRHHYRLDDAVTSLSIGVMSQVWVVFMLAIRIGVYIWIHERFRLGTWPVDAWWTWVLALVFYDFCYYWRHRAMHRVNVLWAAHVVHHSSEEYNLTTALRQTGTGSLLGWIFYVPMAIAGVPPLVFATVGLIDLLYQYWIHTRQIGSLGRFDRVFASPSNHRVHHGINDRYVDRNYGGVLMLWDHLFGTFEPERPDEPVVYGTRAPLRSFNPLWANLQVYAALARDARAARRWRDRLQLWLRPPGWRPADVAAADPQPDFSLERIRPFRPPTPASVRWHAAAQFALALVVTIAFLQAHRSMAPVAAMLCAGWLTGWLIAVGGLLEGRRGFAWLAAASLLATLALALAGSWFGTTAMSLPVRLAIGASALGMLAALPPLVLRQRRAGEAVAGAD
jgi:alkylglycerol monooxygenase